MQYKIAKKLYNLFDLQDTVGLCSTTLTIERIHQ